MKGYLKGFNSTIVVLIGVLLSSCKPGLKLTSESKTLNGLIQESTVFKNHFTGFALYDPTARKFIYQHNTDLFFTPASNTKILTLLAALTYLPDPLPSFFYLETSDSLIIKGMGDPTLFHPLWPENPGVQKLRSSSKEIILITDQISDFKLGPGWAWDDYQDNYQAEVNDLPLFGNLVTFQYDSVVDTYSTFPRLFQNSWYWSRNEVARNITRRLDHNEFYIDTASKSNELIPFKTDKHRIFFHLLEDTLKKNIANGRLLNYPNRKWNIQSGPADSLYAMMMKESDNFIAEQLILLAGSYTFDTCHSSSTISKFKKTLFPDSLQSLQWVDGSGLSRYNLFTPKQVIYALEKIKDKKGYDWITQIFPGGGESGTVKNWYHGSPTYIYAKNRLLIQQSFVERLSQDRSGKWLLFSFMHSNYTGSVIPIRKEMQQVLEFIRDHY